VRQKERERLRRKDTQDGKKEEGEIGRKREIGREREKKI
jgi:hypothetical protein